MPYAAPAPAATGGLTGAAESPHVRRAAGRRLSDEGARHDCADGADGESGDGEVFAGGRRGRVGQGAFRRSGGGGAIPAGETAVPDRGRESGGARAGLRGGDEGGRRRLGAARGAGTGGHCGVLRGRGAVAGRRRRAGGGDGAGARGDMGVYRRPAAPGRPVCDTQGHTVGDGISAQAGRPRRARKLREVSAFDRGYEPIRIAGARAVRLPPNESRTSHWRVGLESAEDTFEGVRNGWRRMAHGGGVRQGGLVVLPAGYRPVAAFRHGQFGIVGILGDR